MCKRYKLLISYDGTNFSGWQIQPNAPTIQQTLERALQTILKKRTPIYGSGRTDAGVHAHAQTAHIDAEIPNLPQFHRSLNGLLPPSIRIHTITPTDETFHARFSARRKIYHYHLHLDPILSPFKRGYTLHIRHPFNENLLQQALPHFIGTHDFAAFTNKSETQKNTTRTIYRIEALPETHGLRLEFEGGGFLYKMVRNITGTLLDVAAEKLTPSAIPQILATRDRRKASRAAAPHALFLASVHY